MAQIPSTRPVTRQFSANGASKHNEIADAQLSPGCTLLDSCGLFNCAKQMNRSMAFLGLRTNNYSSVQNQTISVRFARPTKAFSSIRIPRASWRSK
jgi:hypothetical protein